MRFYVHFIASKYIIISIIGTLCTIGTIIIGFKEIKLTISEQRFSNRLELAEDLMTEYISLSSYASKAAFYLVADANGASEKLIEKDANYPNYATGLLPVIFVFFKLSVFVVFFFYFCSFVFDFPMNQQCQCGTQNNDSAHLYNFRHIADNNSTQNFTA